MNEYVNKHELHMKQQTNSQCTRNVKLGSNSIS